jgi:hypothetical protein
MILVICSGLPVEVEMLDASAACVFPTINIPLGKGAYTSPADGVPQGDTFDIDFVVHEIGHQLGANHTFSHELEETPVNVNVEPGSGSTIME